MPDSAACPKCAAPIPTGSPAGLCPQCLMQAGLESAEGSSLGLPTGNSTPREPAATAPSPQPAGFVPPTVEELRGLLPQLEVLKLLGKGGMGAVYKARQPGLDRLVAVKILPPEVGRDPAFAERFTREARSLARLNHPQIVAVYDFGQSHGLYYFVMEYVEGVNLREMIRGGQMAPEQALAIVPQVCDALQFAHDEGIVHRDIKPENILLDKRGRVKIADFGLAKLLGQEGPDHHLTATQQVMGTLRYMAPEQMQGSRTVDHRADIYSLGVVFYELLTGEVPVGRFTPPSEMAKVDARLDEVVLKTLEREPDRRYQRAGEVKTRIESIASNPAIVAAAVTPAATLPPHPAAASPMFVEATEEEKAHAREQLFWPAMGLLAVVVLDLLFVLGALGIVGSSLVVWRTAVPGQDIETHEGADHGAFDPGVESTHAFDLRRPAAAAFLPPPVLGQMSVEQENMNWRMIVVLIGGGIALLVSSAVLIVIAMGAWSMLRLAAYPLAVCGAIAAMLPIHPACLIGLPIGIWAIIVLLRPEVSAAFPGGRRRNEPHDGPPVAIGGGVVPAPKPFSDEQLNQARQAARGPATGLMVVAGLNLLVVVAPLILVVLLVPWWAGSTRGPRMDMNAPRAFLPAGISQATIPAAAIAAIQLGPLQHSPPPVLGMFGLGGIEMVILGCGSLALTALIGFGGWMLLRLENYPLAVLGAVAAMLPCHPAFILGLPIGIWALLVLMREDVKAAFGRTP